MGRPLVSVLMPTYKHAAFIRRALQSLLDQSLSDWELVVVDDASPDGTREVLAPYLADGRIRYLRLAENGGIGAALNLATGLARGRYIAYLPSDDVYFPDHLLRLVEHLKASADVYLVYGGVRWGWAYGGPTLHGDVAVGREVAALATPYARAAEVGLPNGNILAMVQVAHRRDLEAEVRWTPRDEVVTDRLEPDFWQALLARGVRFAYAGAVTCQWVDHPDQHHKIAGWGRIDAGPTALRGAAGRGRSAYRSYYGIGRGRWLNWRPSAGGAFDEAYAYGDLAVERDLPAGGGLKILLVGELGFNPERILAFEERGHKLLALWLQRPEFWDATGPLPFGNVEDIPYDGDWRARVRAARPDVIYALLNWQALPLIQEVLDARLDIPIVFHFKEGPAFCQWFGLWPALQRALAESDGQILISQENLDWLSRATDAPLDPETVMLLDGDLPRGAWMTADWQPKLSDADGEVHTVCAGRLLLDFDTFDPLVRARVHVHLYGEQFHEDVRGWSKPGLDSGYLHLHPIVYARDWVRELSRYDAAWMHVFRSENGGDVRRATWDDLNLPARIGAYAAAGLPWIMRDNAGAAVATQRLAARYDVAVPFQDAADLAARLRDREGLARLTANMRRARRDFAFDSHVDRLVAFFQGAIERRRRRGRPRPAPAGGGLSRPAGTVRRARRVAAPAPGRPRPSPGTPRGGRRRRGRSS
ncbi:MAG TPA: glycosyltransferase family 2 protein [Chloroflexota bacterium]|nr:glycosyltransferase family 2 protein [Chloroflexota bacterium]